MAYKITKRSSYAIGKMIEKFKDGFFDRSSFGTRHNKKNPSSGLIGNYQYTKIHIYNASDNYIKSGDLAYVYGCNMPAYLYEEAFRYVANIQACVTVRNLQPGDNPDDLTKINTEIEPWSTALVWSGVAADDLFFGTVLLSHDFDGSPDFYYAKVNPIEDETVYFAKDKWFYRPSFVTAKKDDMATYRIFDGSDLPAALVYPDYYKNRSGRYTETPPKVVLALMKKLDASPESPHIGRYLATVVKDTTITESSRSVLVEVSTGGETFQETASSPLSSKGDQFRKGQKVLIAPFENGDADYVIINAEC